MPDSPISLLPSEPKSFDAHQNVVNFWMRKGASKEIAEGIYSRVVKESGGDPARLGDGGTSLGLYQHHAERMKTLLANVENDQAFREVMSDDPIASQHWAEIKAAPDRAAAARLWDRYFERSAASQRVSATKPAAARNAPPRSFRSWYVQTRPPETSDKPAAQPLSTAVDLSGLKYSHTDVSPALGWNIFSSD